jgi:UDP-3-O-[3-hydroxymyristoyl] glucosamine N-acyltransferase
VRLGDLAEALTARVEGDPDVEVDRVCAPETAMAGALAIGIERRYRAVVRETRASAVLLDATAPLVTPDGCVRLLATRPREAFARALRLLNAPDLPGLPAPGVDARAAVDPTACVGPGARIGPFAVVGARASLGDDVVVGAGAYIGADAVIGARTVLAPRAVVLDGCLIGADCLLGPGATVGAVGFGLDAAGRLPHHGLVVIEDDVTLGANTCVDRATLGETRIGRGCHLDNLVQVGHNVRLGNEVVLCGQVGIAGGAHLEDGVVVGGQAGIAGHVTVGARTRIAAQSGVTRSLPAGGVYSGHPAEPNAARLRRVARLRRLADGERP